MGLVVAVLIGALAQAPAGSQTAAPVVVAGPLVRLGDVADLAALPAALRRTAAKLPVARFAPGHATLTISGQSVAERARGQLPALAPWLAALAPATIRVVRAADPDDAAPSMASCLRALRAVAAGDVLATDDVEAADCAGSPPALGYDRQSGLARTRSALAAGEIVRGAPPSLLSAAQPGAHVTLRAAAGPVLVEREVVVVRGARPGARLDVRGDDGEAFSATLAQVAR